jgi:hypothetical protein
MIEISEPLPESKVDLRTVHDILLDGKRVGHVNVEYIQKDEVKTFRKYTKRKLKVGQPFGVHVFIDAVRNGVKASDLGKDGLLKLIDALIEKFRGLEKRDIYVLELNENGKEIVGKASEI